MPIFPWLHALYIYLCRQLAHLGRLNEIQAPQEFKTSHDEDKILQDRSILTSCFLESPVKIYREDLRLLRTNSCRLVTFVSTSSIIIKRKADRETDATRTDHGMRQKRRAHFSHHT
jgi:hypothetical protein